ncbi:MAG TPA: DUF5673 domain-containing protein [Patescibacteria group bacterium]|nr:DUF5673 domain-containing protein [Patescibacteria group bacterium]
MPQDNLPELVWQAPEFRHYPKSAGWYAALIACVVLVVAFFIIVETDLFAAISLGIIGLLILAFAAQRPQTVDITLTHKGIRFGSVFYPYKQIRSFWIVNNDRHRTLNFHTSAMVNNTIIMELAQADPETVRLYLLNFLPEHPDTEETVVQKIMHRFNF